MYKTKYLPVEGEIKIGDSVEVYVPVGQTPYYKAYEIVTGYNVHEDTLLFKDSYVGRGFCKKVKLFLISDDIQVGDEVLHLPLNEKFKVEKLVSDSQGNIWTYWHGLPTFIYSKGEDKNFCIKVIGEIINPEGIKEGQAFTDDRIYFEGGFQGFIPDNLNDFKDSKIRII